MTPLGASSKLLEEEAALADSVIAESPMLYLFASNSTNEENVHLALKGQRKSPPTLLVPRVMSFIERKVGAFQLRLKQNCKFPCTCSSIIFDAHVHRSLHD